jgi:cytochrome c peroxidase
VSHPLALTKRTAPLFGAALLAIAMAFVGLRFAFARSSAPLGPPKPASTPPASTPEIGTDASSEDAPPVNERRVALGRKIFFDKALSEPRGTSCASCHDPAHGFAGNNGSTIGVAAGSRPNHFAKRNTPSVLYLKFVRRFHVHWEEDAPLIDARGGFFWDGRSDSIAELVKQPLTNPDEMNNASARQIDDKIKSGDYAEDFRKEFGDAIDDPEASLRALGDAVNAYLLSPEMSPFSSKYDDYIRGRTELTPLEAAGLKLFKDSAKGGCAGCHKLNDSIPIPERSLFTDYGYEALAAPRNRRLPATRDPQYFDLGLCKRPDTHYHTDGEQFCGSFRAPSLRNVATRQSFMHNGAFSKLRDVVSFYATRATNPKRWYTHGAIFDDIPAKYHQYVNVDKAPYNRHEREAPPLDETEIDAIVAFLGTLTDAEFR